MSYCRFENTSNDISDCMEAMDEVNCDMEALLESASSEHEARGMKRFVKLCREVAEIFEGEDV